MTAALAEASRALREALGADRVRDGDSERDLHGVDLSFHTPQRPDLVVYPTSAAEVAQVLVVADSHGIPVTPFGAGTSLEGHVIPVHGGISLDLTRLDRILELSPGQPHGHGAGRSHSPRAAACRGGARPLLPGRPRSGCDARWDGGDQRRGDDDGPLREDAGERTRPRGRASERAGDPHRQPRREDLGRLRPDGAARRLGGHARRDHGGDAPPARDPRARRRAADLLPGRRERLSQRGGHRRGGGGVSRIELLDAWCVAAVNAFSETTYPEGPCLFVEASGSAELVEADLELVQAVSRDEGATEAVHERDPDARSRLWRARHDVAHALAARFPGTKERTTDVCVPLTELAGAVRFARTEIERLGLEAGILGHAGDGNLHVSMQLAPDGVAASEELVRNIVDDALARGGTCTGEHGVGLGKIGALEREHGDLIPLMQAIRASFDPNGIMNPGKVLRAATGTR